jgi:hypothetical protein
MPKGSMSRSGTKKLKTTKNPDGSQQYVRGKTPMARVMTANKNVQTAANAAERAFRKGDLKSSQRMTKSATMLERAELVEAKKEMARRAKKK